MVEETGRDGGEMADGSVKWGRRVEVWLGEDGPAGTQNVLIERVVEGGNLQTVERDDVAMAVRYALDESVHAQPAKVVRHRSSRIGIELSTEQCGHQWANVAILETFWNKREAADGLQEGMHARVAEAKC